MGRVSGLHHPLTAELVPGVADRCLLVSAFWLVGFAFLNDAAFEPSGVKFLRGPGSSLPPVHAWTRSHWAT